MPEPLQLQAMRSSISSEHLGKAIDYAITLVAGWSEPDRGEIRKLFKELEPLVAHNAEVYAQASERLRDLADKESEITKALADLETARTETQRQRETVAAEVASARSKLRADQEAFELERAAKTHELESRSIELDETADRLAAEKDEAEVLSTQATSLKQSAEDALAKLEEREQQIRLLARNLYQTLLRKE